MSHEYTDEDLRIEAARQHATLVEDHVHSVVGEMMLGSRIPSVTSEETTAYWDNLSPGEFDSAEREIDRLLTSSANISSWAIAMGDDTMNPSPHQLDVRGPDGKTVGRVYLAIDPAMPDGLHRNLVNGIADVINKNMTKQLVVETGQDD